MNYEIVNKAELDRWLFEHRHNGCHSIQGPPPPGACYSDGDPIVRPINIAWRDNVTGEEFPIIWRRADGT